MASGSRSRRDSKSVRATDRLASSIIMIGGLGVLIAVIGICAYLVVTVVPLFRAGSAVAVTDDAGQVENPARVFGVIPDEYVKLTGFLSSDGVLRFRRADSGEVVAEGSVLAPDVQPVSSALADQEGLFAFGLSDGRVQLGKIAYSSRVLLHEEVGPYEGLAIGEYRTGANEERPWGYAVERVSANDYRIVEPEIELRDPTELSQGSGAVTRIDVRTRSGNEALVSLREDGTGVYSTVRTVRPLGGGKPRVRLSEFPIPDVSGSASSAPTHLLVTSDAQHVLAISDDGTCRRYSAQHPAQGIALAETIDLTEGDATVTCVRALLGGSTFLIGDSSGRTSAWFAGRDFGATTIDGYRFVKGHDLTKLDSYVTAIGTSPRERMIVIGDAAGNLAVQHVTSEKVVARMQLPDPSAVLLCTITPKGDGVIAVEKGGSIRNWRLDPGYPDVSYSALFGRVHYEGQIEPEYTYQSSSGEDSAEVKLSLTPLIVGTLKATLFSMLFAVPLAVGAALFTSEFVPPHVKRTVKPTIEMMASLPSVVLGFVAAIVIAPVVAEHLSGVIAALIVVPFLVLLAAHGWQMIPYHVAAAFGAGTKLLLILMVLFAACGVSVLAGPIFERALFRPSTTDLVVASGHYEPAPAAEIPEWVGSRSVMSPDTERRLRSDNLYFREGKVVRPVLNEANIEHAIENRPPVMAPSIRSWLDGNYGSPFPGWFVLLLAPVGALCVFLKARLFGMFIDEKLASQKQTPAAITQLVIFTLTGVASVGATFAIATALTLAGIDARDIVLGPFTQRNTLVVGIIMGFAVIPIIYTVSEDALSSVPASLRSASLGSGATPWQTAVRVVLPVAASGIFSACMIGLGRAVGETMIVVMATGNTPAMDWNIFSGFRTLSANIAVELPEAARDSTHYRVLFLCGLVLFAMTFVVNSTAEVVRQRFRKRSAAL